MAQRNLSKCLEEAALQKCESIENNNAAAGRNTFDMGYSSSQGSTQQIHRMLNGNGEDNGNSLSSNDMYQAMGRPVIAQVFAGQQVRKLEYGKMIGQDTKLLSVDDIKVEDQNELSCHGGGSSSAASVDNNNSSNDCEQYAKQLDIRNDATTAILECPIEQQLQYQKLQFNSSINSSDMLVSSTSAVCPLTTMVANTVNSTPVVLSSSSTSHGNVVMNIAGYDLGNSMASNNNHSITQSHNQSDIARRGDASECNDIKPIVEFNRITDTNLAAYSNVNSNAEVRQDRLLQDTVNLSPNVYNCKLFEIFLFFFIPYIVTIFNSIESNNLTIEQ